MPVIHERINDVFIVRDWARAQWQKVMPVYPVSVLVNKTHFEMCVALRFSEREAFFVVRCGERKVLPFNLHRFYIKKGKAL
jgi:hypothetical protein